jgi:Fe-S oxidoreductase
MRKMRVLPQLEGRRGELEKCVFCPKLCRSACPVSNAEPRETVTPWGKMSLAWMAAHGDVPADASHAAPAWACTGCMQCRQACDHENPVADVLLDARDALSGRGAMPEGARRVLEGFVAHDRATREATTELAAHPRVRGDSREALLIGCGYVRHASREARDAVDVATALTGGPVALLEGCCGLPLRLAGDREAFAGHAAAVARSLEGRARLTVVDAGCALAMKQRYAEVGVKLAPRVELLVEQAAGAVGRMKHVPHTAGPVRWHDPCQLGRGLGVYDAPRAVLARALGREPDEFHAHERRELGVCSGAGGLLPSTMPDVARRIASARLDAHATAGGGHVVTACASSLLAMRKAVRARKDPSSIAVDDLVGWIARALGTR